MAEYLADKRSPEGGWFVALWVFATTLAVFMGRAIGDALFPVLAYPALMVAVLFIAPRQAATLDGIDLAQLAGYVTTMVGTGLIVGLAQWRVLHGRSHRFRWWWPATSGGFVLGAFLNVAFRSHLWNLLGDNAIGLISLDILGVAVGWAQWLLLRQRAARAGWWVLASALGWQLGFLARRWSRELITSPTIQAVPDLVLGGAAGLITGVILVWLLRSSAPSPHPLSKGEEKVD